MTDLIKAWPTAIPSEQPAKSPDKVAKLAKSIEQTAQTVVTKNNTQARQ